MYFHTLISHPFALIMYEIICLGSVSCNFRTFNVLTRRPHIHTGFYYHHQCRVAEARQSRVAFVSFTIRQTSCPTSDSSQKASRAFLTSPKWNIAHFHRTMRSRLIVCDKSRVGGEEKDENFSLRWRVISHVICWWSFDFLTSFTNIRASAIVVGVNLRYIFNVIFPSF